MALSATLGLSLAGTVLADEVVFNNGDRLTGKITEAVGDKLTIESKVAGKVSVDMKDVKTFSTDAPLTLKLNDGTVINQKIAAGEKAGEVATAPGGTLQPQPVALNQVKAINPPRVKWTGDVKAGALITRGNSFSDNINFGTSATRRGEDDRISLNAAYLFGQQKDVKTGVSTTSTDTWFVSGKYDYFFAPQWYGYGNLRAERDNVAGLDIRLTPGVGIGYQWIESPGFNFSTEAGATYVYEKYDADDEANKHLAVRLAYHVDKKLNDSVSVFHNMEFLPSVESSSDFNVITDAGIRASLTQRMFTEFKIEWQYASSPPSGTLQNDLRYILNVGWAF